MVMVMSMQSLVSPSISFMEQRRSVVSILEDCHDFPHFKVHIIMILDYTFSSSIPVKNNTFCIKS